MFALALLAVITGLLMLDAAAAWFGADSRDSDSGLSFPE
jgi:hypothetical protein